MQQKRLAEASRSFYFFLPDPKVGCQPAVLPFWLGAAAIVFIFSFFGFLDSRLPLAMSPSFGLMTS